MSKKKFHKAYNLNKSLANPNGALVLSGARSLVY